MMFALKSAAWRASTVAGRTARLSQSLRCVSHASKTAERADKPVKMESTSFLHNLFCGEAKTDDFFPYPKVLNEEELSFIEMVTEPMSKVYANEYDALTVEKNQKMEDKHFQLLKDMGAFGIQVSPDYGGMGCNNTQYARLAELTCGHDLAVSVILGAHQSIGYKGIYLYGTQEQKDKYLPVLATGEKIAAFALTEPDVGSDASGIKTRAELAPDGKTWILNGSKTYISNGGIADYFTIFAKTKVPGPDGEPKDKVTAFWVPRSEGLTNGQPMEKMGIKTSNTTDLFFDNVKVPAENVIGAVGDGFKVAMNILNNGRYGMCCALSGTMKLAIEKTVAHSNTRSQFGNKLASYTGIQEKIARMTMLQYATQSMAYMLSGLMDNGVKDFHLEAAISKIYASEAASYVVDECLQIHGGMGYIRETGIEKLVRDVRIFRIFEGTNEILRLFTALTGLQYVGGHLREIQRAMKNPVANLGMIFEEGSRRLRRTVGLDAPNLTEVVHPSLHLEAQMLSKNIVTFGSSVEHLLVKYTRDIIHEQMLLNRLANAAIDIYTMLVVLSRATRALDRNLSSAGIECDMTRVICAEANTRISRNLRSLKSPDALKYDELMRNIAKDVISNGSVVHDHPLN